MVQTQTFTCTLSRRCEMDCTRSIIFAIPSKSGSPTTQVKVTEVNGALFFELTMLAPGKSIDLRGLFFNINDDSKLAGLYHSGSGGKVTDFDTVNVIDLGNGANMSGAAPPFDVGLEFGTSGTKDIITTASFTLDNTAHNLTLDDIAHTLFGAKIDGVGGPKGFAKPTVVAPAAPDAHDDSYQIFEDGQSGLNDPSKVPEGVVFQVLANDTDADGDKLTVNHVEGAQHGTVTIVDGDDADLLVGDAVLYTPFLDYAGGDSFTYCITDNHGGTDFANVTVAVTAVADLPTITYEIAAGAVVNEIILTVTATQNDADNSEFIDSIDLSGLPAGVVVTPSASINPAGQPGSLVQQFVLTLPFNQDTSFNLGINAKSQEVSNGDQQLATVTVPIVYEFNRNDLDQSFNAVDQSIWSNGNAFTFHDDRFLGVNESWDESVGSFVFAETSGHFIAGFQSTLDFSGGQIDATVPYDITIDTNYNKTTDVLLIGGDASVAAGAQFTTQGPAGSYVLDFLFDLYVHAAVGIDFGIDSFDIFSIDQGFGPVNENILDINSDDLTYTIDLPAGFSLTFAWPDLDTTSVPTVSSVITATGESVNFLELGLDVDDLVSAILFGGINPFDIGFDIGVASGNIELLDFDVDAGLDFIQNFTLSANDLVGTITFENGASQAFSFATDILLNNASSYDTNNDHHIDFDLELTPLASLQNDTDLGINLGAQFDLLKLSGSYNFGIDSGSISLGPVVSIGGSATVATIDLYNSTFGLNFGSGDVAFMA